MSDMSVIYAVRTTVGREETVLEKLSMIIERQEHGILSILLPKEIRGYILLEALNLNAIEDAIKGVNHVRGLVREPVPFNDIQHFLVAKPTKIKMGKGDIVELISGPFKGEKARIARVDKTKREVIVELVEAAVPIPITVAIESVRVIIPHMSDEDAGAKAGAKAAIAAKDDEGEDDDVQKTSASKKLKKEEMLF